MTLCGAPANPLRTCCDMDGRFLIRPLPLAGESWRGYLLRLADENGLAPLVDLRLVGGSERAVNDVAEAWLGQQYANAGVTTVMPRLRRSGPASPRDEVRFGSQTIQPAYVRYQRCAVCPRCIASTGAVRATWELAAITVCVDHACWLVDQCPACEKSIKWRRQGVKLCSCGHDLSSIQTANAPSDVVALTAWIEQLVWNDLGEGALDAFPAVADQLRGLSLTRALSIFRLFANKRLLSHLPSAEISSTASAALQRDATIACGIAAALSGWPRDFHRLLSGLVDAPYRGEATDRPVVITQAEAMAPFLVFSKGARGALDDYPAFLRSEFQTFLKTRAVEFEFRRFYRAADDSTGYQPWDRTDGPRRSTHGFKAPFRSYRFSPAVVATIIGGTDHQMDLLERSGTVRQNVWVTGDELDASLRRLEHAIEPLRKTDDRPMMTLSKFSRASGDELLDLLRLISGGRLQCYAWRHVRPIGLQHMWVLSEEIHQWRRDGGKRRRQDAARTSSN